MKPITLNTLHRYAGIVTAPLLVVQALSGLFLDFGLFRRGEEPMLGRAVSGVDALLVRLHFGPGLIGDAYHLLLGAGILWMAVSGWLLYLRGRRARRKLAANAKTGASMTGKAPS
ncbi:hypothetical protein [Geobacter sp.]|uniref:hypothetical protein n=1 Tax=Geobacter sp. TaxID=46610 RepID=UPI00262FFAEF|nr:hypothetical protein [Geobacter sp.]